MVPSTRACLVALLQLHACSGFLSGLRPIGGSAGHRISQHRALLGRTSLHMTREGTAAGIQASAAAPGPTLEHQDTPAAASSYDGVLPHCLNRSNIGKLEFVYPQDMEIPLCAAANATKPLLLFIPGFDGTNMFKGTQFADLSQRFEVRALTIPAEDRLDAAGLVQAIEEFVVAWYQESPCSDKPILLGESMGGLLSLLVSLRAPSALNSIVLVNPATSYRDTAWPIVGRLLSGIPDVVPRGEQRLPDLLDLVNLRAPMADRGLLPDRSLGELAFAGLAGPLLGLRALDAKQMRSYARMAVELAVSVAGDVPSGRAPERVEEIAKQSVAALEMVLGILPPATVKHRIKVLEDGTKMMEKFGLEEAEVPCLVIAGDDDNLLPSKDESQRLKKEMQKCEVSRMDGGHLLMEGSLNISKILQEKKLVMPASFKTNPVDGWSKPSREQIENATESILTLRRLASPVFLSTDEATGQVEVGLRQLDGVLAEAAESGQAVLFVGNHQLLALDLGVLIEGVYRETGTFMRGLAHPMLFNSASGGVPGAMGGGTSGNMYTNFGAVPVSARNFAKLLQKGDSVLLFPGGLGEALHSKDELYTLKWPEKTDFVRLAARYNATIVPFGGVGASEASSVLFDPQEAKDFAKSPVGKVLARAFPGAADTSRAVAGGSSEWGDVSNADRLAFTDVPVVVPKAPWQLERFYFLFGAPISTEGIDVKDLEACGETYQGVQDRVNDCLKYLQDNREKDPYKELGARFLYETQYARPAPTFLPPPLGKK